MSLHKGLGEFNIKTYVRIGSEDLCIPISDICCGGRLRFRLLCPVLQLFKLC